MTLVLIYLQCGRLGFDPWVRKIPWKRKWQPTPVFLPGEFHGERSFVGYSPCGHKELDMTDNTFLVLPARAADRQIHIQTRLVCSSDTLK